MMADEQVSRFRLEPFTFTTFKEEAKNILIIGWILAVSLLCEYLMFTICVFFCSRLGNKEMAAIVLSQQVIAVTGVVPGAGMMTVCNTYFAAGHGASHGRKQGIFLQKAIFLSVIASLFCCSILINIEQLMLIFHQDPDVARLTGVFVRTYMPATLALFCSLALTRILQSKNKVAFTLLTLLFSVIVNAFLNFLFVNVLEGGFRGSAIATVVSQYVCLIILCIYVYKYEDLELFSIESLENWGEFFSIAFHGGLTVTMAQISIAVCYLLAGKFGVFYTDVFGAVEVLVVYLYTIWIGFCSATAILVGQYFGQNEPKKAKTLTEISLILSWMIALFLIILLLIFRNYLGYMYTSDQAVIHELSTLVPIIILYQLSASTVSTCKSVFLASGKQYIGTITTVISNVVGFPIIIFLAFLMKWKVFGLWAGVVIGDSFQAVLVIILLIKLDFWKEAELALKRCELFQMEEAEGDISFGKMKQCNNNETTSEEAALIQSYDTFKLNQKTIIFRLVNFIVPTFIFIISLGIYVI